MQKYFERDAALSKYFKVCESYYEIQKFWTFSIFFTKYFENVNFSSFPVEARREVYNQAGPFPVAEMKKMTEIKCNFLGENISPKNKSSVSGRKR